MSAPASAPAFTIKTPQFEGPLDLLLSLIEKRKLFINEISLAKVTDDFIGYVQSLQQFPLGDSAHFILVASTLLLIKSRSLLPSLPLTTEEEESIGDLELRLKIYQEIRGVGEQIREQFGGEVIFPAEARKREPLFTPLKDMNLGALSAAMDRVLQSLPKKEALPKIAVRKVMSLEQMIVSLTERVQNSLRMSFREFSKAEKHDKIHVIVSFLAMLELVKQGTVSVSQERDFADITIETNAIGTPKYGA